MYHIIYVSYNICTSFMGCYVMLSLSNVHCHISARETESDRERVRGNDRENEGDERERMRRLVLSGHGRHMCFLFYLNNVYCLLKL